MMKDDIAKVYFTEEELQAKVRELGRQITEDYKDAKEDIYCVGILKGASVFYTDLVRAIDLPVRFDFMIASSYGSGTSTTGSVKILKKYFEHRKPASVKLCALLSKPSRRTAEVAIDYCGFEVPDEFLVGYGLDYAEIYRNLPYIGVLKPEVYA